MTDIIKLYDLLKVVSSTGIDTLAVEPSEDGTLFRGVDDTQSIYLFDTYSDVIIEKGMGIHSLKTLLRRLELFENLEKTEVNIEDLNEDWAKRINLKSDTIDISYTFTSADALQGLPTMVASSDIIQAINFDKDTFNSIDKAMQSMTIKREDVILFKGRSKKVTIELEDGVADRYKKQICDNQAGENWSAQWRAVSLKKLISESLNHSDECIVKVSDRSIGFVDVSDLTFMLAPE